MKLGPRARSRTRIVVLIGGCLAAGAIAVPGVSVAAKAVQDVFVTNTAANPVPVAPQGTTQVAGTVTVANQPEPPAAPEQPRPVQIRLEPTPATHDQPTAAGILYTVPEGKLLTIEYAQLYFSAPADAYNASIHVLCIPPNGETELLDRATTHLPEIEGPNLTRIFGGPVKLQVAEGHCLRFTVTIRQEDIGENHTFFVNGYVSGYLSDLPG